MKEYYIFSDSNKVQAWSTKKIPFEPKGWQTDMRNQIREAISNITTDSQYQFYARYTSQGKELCDVENILFYNIGSKPFNKLNVKYLLFERDFQSPPEIAYGSGNFSENYNHYYLYEVHEIAHQTIWCTKTILAWWEGISFENITYDSAFYWSYIKRSYYECVSEIYSGNIGVELYIRVPKKSINIFNTIKPLLDGIICAFHQHNALPENEIIDNIAQRTSQSGKKISEWLYENSPLDARNIVSLYRRGIKWNPADDRIVIVTIHIETDTPDWRIDGKLFSVKNSEVNT